MTKKELKANVLLLLTAAIWGFSFVAQRVGSEHLGAFTFNGIRFAIGSISLVPLIIFFHRKKENKVDEKLKVTEANKKQIFKAGLIAGIVLFAAAALQQIGMASTTAGKGGFITGIYMVIVPVLGLFLKQKTNRNTWIGIGLAIIGLYLLTITNGFSIGKGDLLVLMSSFMWAIHILIIDNFTKKIDPLKLSCIQFATCSVLSLVIAFGFETITVSGVEGALMAILYGGILSVGVAYTLQVVAQKDAKPTHAAILLSMESVFGVIGGALFLGEKLNGRGLIGCVLIFIAIIISQIKPADELKAVNEEGATIE